MKKKVFLWVFTWVFCFLGFVIILHLILLAIARLVEATWPLWVKHPCRTRTPCRAFSFLFLRLWTSYGETFLVIQPTVWETAVCGKCCWTVHLVYGIDIQSSVVPHQSQRRTCGSRILLLCAGCDAFHSTSARLDNAPICAWAHRPSRRGSGTPPSSILWLSNIL